MLLPHYLANRHVDSRDDVPGGHHKEVGHSSTILRPLANTKDRVLSLKRLYFLSFSFLTFRQSTSWIDQSSDFEKSSTNSKTVINGKNLCVTIWRKIYRKKDPVCLYILRMLLCTIWPWSSGWASSRAHSRNSTYFVCVCELTEFLFYMDLLHPTFWP